MKGPRDPQSGPTGIAPLQTWRARLLSRRALAAQAVLLAAAIVTGFVALYFRIADNFGSGLFLRMHELDSIAGVHLPGGTGPWLAALTVTVGMVAIIWLRDRFFPGTEGTGIPQAIACLKVKDSPFRRYMLSVRIAIGKILLLTIGLFTGMTIGREGPSVHVGACLMYLATKVRRFPDHLVQRGLILAGGGAGIAAAFNAPIAGMIFAFEEIGRSFEKDNASTIVRTVVIASLVVIATLGWDYLFYGQVHHEFGFDGVHWLCIVVIAVIGGFLGGLFARAVVWGTPLVTRALSKRRLTVAACLGLALAITGLLSEGQSYGSGYPQARSILLYRGTDYYATLDVSQDATLEEITEAYTRKAHAQTLLGQGGKPMEEAMQLEAAYTTLGNASERAFYDEWHMPGPTPWWYAPAKATGSFFSLISGIPGGLFDPSLSVGAGLGDVFADFFHSTFNGIRPQFVIMLFMVAYFAGVVQSPITVFVIMIEMTDARMVTIPLMLCAVIAYECSSLVCTTSIYEALAELFLGAVKRRSNEECPEGTG
ncbi:MAG: chloride channel protein [Phycisphaerales bacterium]|jgi:H+/Cl- antiporter ClcA|nr:chloride channel protein [Phycisphaerales bacterium]